MRQRYVSAPMYLYWKRPPLPYGSVPYSPTTVILIYTAIGHNVSGAPVTGTPLFFAIEAFCYRGLGLGLFSVEVLLLLRYIFLYQLSDFFQIRFLVDIVGQKSGRIKIGI